MRIYKKGEKVLGPDGKLHTVAKAIASAHPVTPGRQIVSYTLTDAKGNEVLATERDVRTPPKK